MKRVEAPSQSPQGVGGTLKEDLLAIRDILLAPVIPIPGVPRAIRRQAIEGLRERHPWLERGID